MLCILTSKQDLCMPFAGQNCIFCVLTSFALKIKKEVKKGGKKRQKLRKIYFPQKPTIFWVFTSIQEQQLNAGSPPFCVFFTLFLKFFFIFRFLMEKDDFDQQTVYKAPVCRSKYTTTLPKQIFCNQQMRAILETDLVKLTAAKKNLRKKYCFIQPEFFFLYSTSY